MNSKSAFEDKWENTFQYIDLMFEYWEVRRKLLREFPDKLFESNRYMCERMLETGLIKCKHEK